MNTKKSLGNSKGKGGFFNVSIKKQWLLNIFMVLLSWITFPFLGVKNIKRFLPASLIVGVLEIIHASIGKKRKWWVFYNKPNSYLFDELPFNLGPFFLSHFGLLKFHSEILNCLFCLMELHMLSLHILTHILQKE